MAERVNRPTKKLEAARYYQIMERLRQETQTAGSNVMVTAQDRDVSLLQSELARQAEADKKLDRAASRSSSAPASAAATGSAGSAACSTGSIAREAHPLMRPASTAREALADPAKIALRPTGARRSTARRRLPRRSKPRARSTC